MSFTDTILEEGKAVMPPNGRDIVDLTGANMVRFFKADGDFKISLNGGRPVRMTRGKKILARPEDKISRMEFIDESGAANTVRFYYGAVDVADDTLNIVGVESVTIEGQIESINNPVPIDDSTPLKVQTPTRTAAYDGQAVTTDGVVISGKRWVRVQNTHATADLTLSLDGGFSITLVPGGIHETPTLPAGESLSDITINADSSNAAVEYINP